MRRLILQTSVSIDGYVAALDKSHPWSEGSEEESCERQSKRQRLRGSEAFHVMNRV